MKKINVLLLLVAVASCLFFSLSACDGNEVPPDEPQEQPEFTYYTVTFDSQGGSAVPAQRVLAGNPLQTPAAPSKEGFDFVGWYIASDPAERWDFVNGRVNGDMTLYAQWTQAERPAQPETLMFERIDEGYVVTGDDGQNTNIVIPEVYDGLPVVGISERAFSHAHHPSSIISVTIPDSVTAIGQNAFYDRQELVSVNIGANSRLVSIGNNAFSGCVALTSVFLPAGVTEIGGSAFNNCGGLNGITVASGNSRYSGEGNNLIERATGTLIRGSNESVIPETVRVIGEAAFRRAQLTVVNIPSSVVSVEKYAFSDSAIATIVYGGTTEEWEKATTGQDGKETHWKSSKQTIDVKCSDTKTKILVAYFSATNTTKGVAEKIAKVTGGTLFAIVPQQPYTSQDLNYNDPDSRSSKEQNDRNARPAIDGSVQNSADYDVIFLGYPIWWGQAPKIICTFLESYDFSGKTIIPFCTSGSSGIGGSEASLRQLAASSVWKAGKRFAGSASEGEIAAWIDGLGL